MKFSKWFMKLTPVSIFHYIRLIYRSLLFLLALTFYLYSRFANTSYTFSLLERPLIIRVIWIVFTVEMIMRFFPSKIESPGCQKQFKKNYIKSGKSDIQIQDNNATVFVLILWICFNAIFGALYMTGILDQGIMLLLCCAYSICDMICILFFCPFQSWFLKNKCCSTCRIYNWDYAMMFTPLFFIPNPYSWSLLAMSVALLLRWEITFYFYPERFSENTNDYIKCANCTEKLCTHKRQLHSLWGKIAAFYAKRKQFLENKT